MKTLINDVIDKNEENFDKFVFYACMIDLLFLPYVWFISVPYTMPLLFFWLFKRHNTLIGRNEYKIFLIMVLFMIMSTIFSFMIVPQYAYKNIAYLIQFTTMFLYYFLFLNYVDQAHFNIVKFLKLFIIFVILFAVLFNLDKELYHRVVLLWNRRSGISINENYYVNFIGYRYSFIWMDANNIGYMMNAIVLYLWCNEKTSFFTKTFTLLSLLFVLVSCMSNGGFLSFFIIVGIYIIVETVQLFTGKHKERFRINAIDVLLFLITVVTLAYVIPQIPKFLETGVVLESMERMDNNSGDSRFEIWNLILQNVNFVEYLLIGKGGVTLVNKIKFSPHNGHFYWILGYGFISYFIFMYLIFRKRKITNLKQYIWIIPILIGFTVNVIIGEIKMMGIILLLLACSTSQKYLEKSDPK